MTAPLMLLVAASSMMSGAIRLKLIPGFGATPHTITSPMMHPGPTIQTPASLPHIRMQVAAPLEDETPQFGLADDGMPESRWKDPEDEPLQSSAPSVDDMPDLTQGLDDSTGAYHTDIASQQTIPPTTHYGIDAWQLLKYWADPNVHLLREEEDNEALVRHNMLHAVAEATYFVAPPSVGAKLSHMGRAELDQKNSLLLEMVALIPNPKEIPLKVLGLESPLNPKEIRSLVMAIGVFSRGQIKDDSIGSLHKIMEERNGILVGSRNIDVFAIQGVADPSGDSEELVMALLSKLDQYAQEEQKMVVVPKEAYTSRGGKDLTEYYVRLGFEKVEMNNGLHELVYTGTSSSAERSAFLHGSMEIASDANDELEDTLAENQLTMVGMNLWKGVATASNTVDVLVSTNTATNTVGKVPP